MAAVDDELSEAQQAVVDPDPRRRVEVVCWLAGRREAGPDGRAKTVELLGRLVDDKADYVRWNVAVALGRIADRSGLALLRRLAGDEHANVRLRVALAVALIGDPAGLDILVGLSADPYVIGDAYPVRSFAALALGVLGAAEGVGPLVRLADDADSQVRWHATVALGDLRDPGGVAALVARTEDAVPFVRAHAAIGLAEIGSPAGREAVQRVAVGDPVERVRGIAERALASLEEAAR